jgi:hypothetical protein
MTNVPVRNSTICIQNNKKSEGRQISLQKFDRPIFGDFSGLTGCSVRPITLLRCGSIG